MWCESYSCQASVSGSVTMPDLPTTTLSTTALSTATVNFTSQPAETTTGVVTSTTTSTSTATGEGVEGYVLLLVASYPGLTQLINVAH